jgi:hypothetical protein
MEKLNSEKFQCLSNEAMEKIEGGRKWGYHIDYAERDKDGSTHIHYHHYNIWGNYDGGYANTYD